MTTLHLVEHTTSTFDEGVLTPDQGVAVQSTMSAYVGVEFPSLGTGWRWRLSPSGWVGAVEVDGAAQIVISPKVPIANFVRLLATAYDVPLRTFPGIASSTTMPELYDQIAGALAQRVLALGRQGFHHAYRPAFRSLPAVRGRLDFARLSRRPAGTDLPCRYDDRTADVIENRIPLWTLDRVCRSPLSSNAVRRTARESYRRLVGIASLEPCDAAACAAIRYDRLTERYRQTHALCRLLLENLSPIGEVGSSRVVPFLVNMPLLFERFVANWLRRHLPPGLRLRAQERATLGARNTLEFSIDLVLYDDLAGRPLCVLDTKYKAGSIPLASDVAQVNLYASLKSCGHAILVYPTAGVPAWRGEVGGAVISTAVFDIGGDLEVEGRRFLEALLSSIGRAHTLLPLDIESRLGHAIV